MLFRSEIDVDAVRAMFIKRRLEIARLVIYAAVETQVLDDMAALLRSAGDTNYAAAQCLCDLADDAANAARGCGNNHGLAGLRTGDVDDAAIGGQAGHAQHVDMRPKRRLVEIDRDNLVFVEDAIVLDSSIADDIAGEASNREKIGRASCRERV